MLVAQGPEPDRIVIDGAHLNSTLHPVCDDTGRPIVLKLQEGQMSDHIGERLIFNALPSASSLIADKGFDSNWFRTALIAHHIEPCIPPARDRTVQVPYDKALYQTHHRIVNILANLKDW